MRLKRIWFSIKKPQYVNSRLTKGGKRNEKAIAVLYVRYGLRIENLYHM